jgi:hypothetical protein
MANQLTETVGNLYQNFLGRDLTYVASGALMVGSMCYVVSSDEQFTDLINKLIDKPIAFIIFLTISYFFGLIVKEGICQLLEIKKKWLYGESKLSESEKLELYSSIKGEHREDSLKRIERTIYLMHVGLSFGIGSFVSLIVLILNCQRVSTLMYIVLVTICVFSFLEYYKKHKQHKEIVDYLLTKMKG